MKLSDHTDLDEQTFSKGKSWLILICLSFNSLITAFNNASPTFYTDTPPFTCKGFEDKGDPCNLLPDLENHTIFNSSFSDSSTCTTGYEFHAPNNESTVVTEWQLVCDKRIHAALSTSFFYVSVAIGALITGMLADLYGRKKVLFTCIYSQAILGISTSFSNSLLTFTILRCLQGLFVQGVMSATSTLVNEVLTNMNRTITNGTVELFWSFGLVLLATLSFLLPNWRHLEIALSLVPLIVATFSLWIVPESRTWKESRKIRKLDVIDNNSSSRKHNIFNAKNNKGVLKEEKINEHLKEEEEKELIVDSYEKETNANTNSGEGKKTLLKQLKNLFYISVFRNRLILMSYLWTTEITSYFGVTLSIPILAGDKYINFIIGALLEVIFFISMGSIIYKYGRRRAMYSSCFTSGVLYLMTAVLSFYKTNKTLAIVRTCLVIFGKGCVMGNHMCLLLFAMELFPTELRAMTLGVCMFISEAAVFFSPLINLTAYYLWEGTPFVVFGSMNLISSMLAFTFLPETQNLALPTTLEDAIRIQIQS